MSIKTWLYSYDPVKDPCARLRLEYDPDHGNAILADENTHPEQRENPNARFIKTLESIQLTTAMVRWLSEATRELLPIMEQCDAEIQAQLDAERLARDEIKQR